MKIAIKVKHDQYEKNLFNFCVYKIKIGNCLENQKTVFFQIISLFLVSGNFSPISSTVREAVLAASPIQFRARQEYVPRIRGLLISSKGVPYIKTVPYIFRGETGSLAYTVPCQ